MSYQDSPFSTMYGQDDYDIDEDNDEYLEDDRDGEEQDESDEGTISSLKIQSQLLCCENLRIFRYRGGKRNGSWQI